MPSPTFRGKVTHQCALLEPSHPFSQTLEHLSRLLPAIEALIQSAQATADARASPAAPEPAPMIHLPGRGQLADFTHIHTIYDNRVQLVTLPVMRVPGRVPDAPVLADQPELVGPLVVALFHALGLDHDQEHYLILMCDARLQVYGFKHVASGGRHQTDVDGGLICRHALLLGAVGIIAAHNHPSGHLEPSRADRFSTRVLRRATSAVHLALHDHIIHAPDGSYVSMRTLDPPAWPR